jgi:protein O-GlcNAc transferase
MELTIDSKITIVDIGAAINNDDPWDQMVDADIARVIGFEPNQDLIEALNEKHKDNSNLYLPYFVGDGEPGTFYETNWGLTGSLYKPNKEYLERYQNLSELVTLVKEHPIETHTLDSITEIEDVDLLKLDVQGAELKIFEHGLQKIAQSVVIQAEVNFVPLYEDIPLFSEVETFLRSHGMSFHTFYPLGFGQRCLKPLLKDKNPNIGFKQLLWSDAIFIRAFNEIKNLSIDKLKKSFLILHLCYQSYDFAYAMLTQLAAISNEDHRLAYQAVLANRDGLKVSISSVEPQLDVAS